MEIELKFFIPSEEIAEEIWNNRLFKAVEEDDSREDKFFHAKYFDTEFCELAKHEVAYRIRQEGDRFVAALKWKGHSEDGLHVREEINIPVDGFEPDVEVFKQSTVASKALEFLHDHELQTFLETKVRRRTFRIDTGKGIYEISIDSGEIVTNYGSCPISEVEIELFSGDKEELIEIGKKLCSKYDLSPENESKYARGMALIRANRQSE